MATQYTPTFSPAGGTYSSAQTVTIASSGATAIYYTLDGTIPTTASSVYSSPLTVTSSQTISAFAVKTGIFSSPVARATYFLSSLATGKVGAWLLNEGSGAVLNDTSSSAQNMSLTNGAWGGALGPTTQCVTFNGTTTHADTSAFANLNFNFSDPFSISAWVSATVLNANQVTIGRLDTAASFRGWELILNKNTASTYFASLLLVNTYPTNSIETSGPAGGISISGNAWHHLVYTYDGSHSALGVALYVDGNLQGISNTHNSLTTTTTNTSNIRMGARLDGTVPFTGHIGPIYVYNRVLAQAEVSTLYGAPYGLSGIVSTTYYVAANGNDANDGKSTGAPWKTLTPVNAASFQPGDQILFRGGDTFAGTFTQTLAGLPSLPIVVSSYGTGQATISSTTANGMLLANSHDYVISNLILLGSGWTGSGTGIVPLNSANGIHATCTNTTGPQLQNCFVTGCTISGYYNGIYHDATTSASVVGFNNVYITSNNLSNNLNSSQYLAGFHAFAGGSVTQNSNVFILNNTAVNIPGDPNFTSEAQAFTIANCTTGIIQGNYCNHVAGFGGSLAGLAIGGSSGMAVVNCRAIQIIGNEITNTACSTHFDGGAIDLDQDSQNCVVAYNLTYNNVGASVQYGSFGGKTTQNNSIHHNISYNDVRGNNTGGTSEQGAITSFGGAANGVNQIFNNTIYVDSTGTVGVPSCFTISGAPTASPQIVCNNIFKVTGGISIIHAAQTTNPSHLGTQTIINNLYDASGGSLLISNDTGAAYVNVTTLVAWQAAGYEKIVAALYGVVGAATLKNLAGFDTSSIHSPLPALTNFDLVAGSAAAAAAIDSTIISGGPTLIGLGDWHAFTIPASPLNIGALNSTITSSSGTGGKLELLLVGVGS